MIGKSCGFLVFKRSIRCFHNVLKSLLIIPIRRTSMNSGYNIIKNKKTNQYYFPNHTNKSKHRPNPRSIKINSNIFVKIQRSDCVSRGMGRIIRMADQGPNCFCIAYRVRMKICRSCAFFHSFN